MNKTIIFDLDDTLYKEIDYVKSGLNFVSSCIAKEMIYNYDEIKDFLFINYYSGEKVFDKFLMNFKTKYCLLDLLDLYRNHIPKIELLIEIKILLKSLKKNNINLGLLTDGRTVQQKNKIKSLGLNSFFNHVIISEEFGSKKPSEKNFLYFSNTAFPDSSKFFYVGDNTKKDFITPKKLGWDTICLKNDGRNIHFQNLKIEQKYMPNHIINNLPEICKFI